MFKNNTDKLEALWLQLLDYLNVRNSNQYRIFRSMHYTIYVNTVIKNKTITAIINEDRDIRAAKGNVSRSLHTVLGQRSGSFSACVQAPHLRYNSLSVA